MGMIIRWSHWSQNILKSSMSSKKHISFCAKMQIQIKNFPTNILNFNIYYPKPKLATRNVKA